MAWIVIHFPGKDAQPCPIPQWGSHRHRGMAQVGRHTEVLETTMSDSVASHPYRELTNGRGAARAKDRSAGKPIGYHSAARTDHPELSLSQHQAREAGLPLCQWKAESCMAVQMGIGGTSFASRAQGGCKHEPNAASGGDMSLVEVGSSRQRRIAAPNMASYSVGTLITQEPADP